MRNARSPKKQRKKCTPAPKIYIIVGDHGKTIKRVKGVGSLMDEAGYIELYRGDPYQIVNKDF